MLDDSSSRPAASATNAQFWHVPWRTGTGILATVMTLLFVYGGVALASLFIQVETNLALGGIYVLSGILTLSAVIYFVHFRGMNIRAFLGARPSWKTLLLVTVGVVVYIQLSFGLQAVAAWIFPIDISQEQAFGFSESFSLVDKAVIFIALVVLAPIAEEFLYRGVLYRGLRRSWGKILAVIVTSLVFGILHGQWNVAIDTFALSIVMIAIMEWNRSLWPAIFLHAIKNGIAFTVVFSGLITR